MYFTTPTIKPILFLVGRLRRKQQEVAAFSSESGFLSLLLAASACCCCCSTVSYFRHCVLSPHLSVIAPRCSVSALFSEPFIGLLFL